MRLRARAVTALIALTVLAGTSACSSSGGGTPTSGAPTSGSTTLADYTTLSGKATTVTLDPGFATKLTALKVTLKPTGKATYDSGSATITLPITGGHATFKGKGAAEPTVEGTFDHAGSELTLSAASQTVTLEDIVVTEGTKGGLAGKVIVGGQPLTTITLFDIDDSTQQTPALSGGVASVTGATLYVSTAAAVAINAVLRLTGSSALPVTKNAIKVGTISIAATGN